MKIKITSKKIILSTIMSIVLSIITPITAFADEDDPINSIATSSSSSNVQDAKPLSKKSQDAIANMLMQSVSLMGIAYKWGGNTPTTGLDCSGFVRYVYQNSLGINLPRTAAEQAKVGKRIGIDNLEPGDLIFFNTKRGSNTHVGIYIGDNKFIQSPRTGENIQISDLSGNWRKNFNGAKRIVQENEDSDNGTELQNFQNIRDEALPVSARATTKKHSKKRHEARGNRSTSTKKSKSKSSTKSVKKSSNKSSNAKKKKKKKS
ncbi:MAG: C40 family peptidase [Burkholderiales bacterium]|nr:C40 family peptidase [Burkholderiales bacterium]